MFYKIQLLGKNMDFLIAINWSVSPEIVKLGPFSIRWYGLFFALAFVMGYQILAWVFKKEEKDLKILEGLTVSLILGTVIGARLGHCLFYEPEFYLSNPLKILEVWNGGLASHGGAFGILIASWIYIKRQNEITYVWAMDRLTIVVALTAMLVRLGNLMNSEIVGQAADVPWAFIFTRLNENPAIPRHPTQIYEALSYFIIFIIMLLRYKKLNVNMNPGSQAGLFLILLFSARFILEYFKENQAAFEHGMLMNMGQMLSIPLIIAGIVVYIRSRKIKELNKTN
jgi:phosphatidylglycerol:prolipoprotein diacylglycerol transferase